MIYSTLIQSRLIPLIIRVNKTINFSAYGHLNRYNFHSYVHTAVVVCEVRKFPRIRTTPENTECPPTEIDGRK